MKQHFENISESLKLSQESRERIRTQLVSYQAQTEVFSMKKASRKIRTSLVAAVVVMSMLAITAAGAAYFFRNDIIVTDVNDIPISNDKNSAGVIGVHTPNDTPPPSLEKMIESDRFKSVDWSNGKMIDGGVIPEYSRWDFAEVWSDDPALRIRRVGRDDGAEKMEYTAENPANLVDTLTGRVAFDLSWISGQYDYVPDANISFVVTSKDGAYVSEMFSALYSKVDNSGYFRIEIYNVAEADYFAQSYIIEGDYETAYDYTTEDGFEFLIRMHKGNVWADCRMSNSKISLYGAYLTCEEIENIIDNLSLSDNPIVGENLAPMVMIDGFVYVDIGEESTRTEREADFDGKIDSSVTQKQKPTKNNQSNFGTGYGYQYGPNGTVEIFKNDKWWVFAVMAYAV